ncbi:hypothetical protein G9A89_020140 [Geosiphon pyriformis]|nr:hypothetical protein G9A89_020140 [Geosiphon pyriformis]
MHALSEEFTGITITEQSTIKTLKRFSIYLNELDCQPKDTIHLNQHVTARVFANSENREIVVTIKTTTQLTNEQYKKRKNKMIDYPLADNAKVDQAFYNEFQGIHVTLIRSIMGLASHPRYKRYGFALAGHGIGGALLLGQLSPSDIFIEAYTFGQPRMGNAVFAKYVNDALSDVFRVTHTDDYVPHYPPRTFTQEGVADILGFWHLQTEYWIYIEDCDCNNSNNSNNNNNQYELLWCPGKTLRERLRGISMTVDENPVF